CRGALRFDSASFARLISAAGASRFAGQDSPPPLHVVARSPRRGARRAAMLAAGEAVGAVDAAAAEGAGLVWVGAERAAAAGEGRGNRSGRDDAPRPGAAPGPVAHPPEPVQQIARPPPPPPPHTPH